MNDEKSLSSRSSEDGSRADRLANEQIDRHLAPTNSASKTAAMASFTPDEQRRVADLLLLDALLASGQSSRKESVQRALDATITRLNDETNPAASVSVATTIVTTTTTAAQTDRHREYRRTPLITRRRLTLSLIGGSVVALLALIAWQYDRSRQAYAMVERMRSCATDNTDRTYRVTIEPGVPLTKRREAKFVVRGGSRFVFDDPGPLGVRLLFGSDGHTRWHLTPSGTVLLPNRLGDQSSTSESETTLAAGAMPADAPYLQLDTLMSRLKYRYQLKLGRRETIEHTGVSCERLSATRIEATDSNWMWPETVDAWSSTRTGAIQRLELRWAPGALPVGPRSLTFELIDEGELGPSYYRPEAHAPKE